MNIQDKKIRIFSLSTCAMCKKLKKFLDEKSIPYENIEVDMLAGSEQWVVIKELKRVNPDATYPTIVVENVITGFHEAKLRKVLDLP